LIVAVENWEYIPGMPDDELSRLQTDIEDHLAATRLEWFRLATEPHTGAERNEAIDRIKASDAHLMALLRRKWAIQAKQQK
jgi:hypothetical protein